MATKKEEKQFEKERKAAIKAREKRMKEEGLEKFLTPDQIKYNKRQKAIGAVWPVFRFLILFGLCFVILYPLIFMLSTAFRPNEQMNDPSIIWIPKNFTMQNIKDTWKVMKFDKTLINTIILNLVSSVLQVVTCSITGYGFARFKFKGKNILFGLVVMMIIVPPQITTIPMYMQYAHFKPQFLAKMLTLGKTSLINSGWTMYLPALFANGIRAGLFIFIFRQFFRGLPKELEDAAYLDGCSPLYTYVKIMIPIPDSFPVLNRMVLERLLCIKFFLHQQRHRCTDAEEPEYHPCKDTVQQSVGICSSDNRLAGSRLSAFNNPYTGNVCIPAEILCRRYREVRSCKLISVLRR